MANVPATTLKRIISLSGNPKAETVIKVFNTAGADELLLKYMNEFHPEIAMVMNRNSNHNKEYTYIDNNESDYYTSEDYFLIMNLASTTSGTTQDEIAYQLGMLGLERLKHLVEVGLIIEDSSGRYFGKTSSYKLSFADTKKRIALSLKYYRLSESGADNNWMSFQTESINAEGLVALKNLSRKHFNERKDQIYNNPMYKGDIKHYSACISSTFLPYFREWRPTMKLILILITCMISFCALSQEKINSDKERIKQVELFNGLVIKANEIEKVVTSDDKIEYIESKDGMIIDSSDINRVSIESVLSHQENSTQLRSLHSSRLLSGGDGSGG